MTCILKIQSTSLNLFCCMYANCDNEYSTKYNLQRHVESVHMHVKRYPCKICSVLFSSRQSLKEHLHVHSGAMPFKCNTCCKVFRQGSQLSIHLRLHKSEGRESDYSVFKTDDELAKIKPLEVCMKVDEEKFLLPKIQSCSNEALRLPSIFHYQGL
jgi:hypothetical protein